MFHVYVDNPVVEAPPLSSLPPTGHGVATKLKTKLTVTGRVEGDMTLAPRLPFSSFDDLKAEIQALLRPLPGAGVSLLSLAYVDSDGDLVELLESTFDPMDFDDFAGDRVVLRAKVLPTGAEKGSLQRPPPAPVQGKKEHSTENPAAPRRRALGRRDENTLAAPTPSRGLRGAAQKAANQATVRSTSPAAATTVTTAGQIQDNKNKRGFAPRPLPARNFSSSSSFSSTSTSTSGSRAPQFVFGAGGGSSLKNTSNAMSRASKAPAGHDVPVQSTAAGNGAAAKSSTARRRRQAPAAPRRPSWDNGNEPAWEEVRQSAHYSLDAAVRVYTGSIVVPTNDCCCSCLFVCRDSR